MIPVPLRRRWWLMLAALTLGSPLLTQPQLHAADTTPQAVMPERHRALLNANCVACHGTEKQKGKFRVDDLPFTTNVDNRKHGAVFRSAAPARACHQSLRGGPGRCAASADLPASSETLHGLATSGDGLSSIYPVRGTSCSHWVHLANAGTSPKSASSISKPGTCHLGYVPEPTTSVRDLLGVVQKIGDEKNTLEVRSAQR
jgi:hypothetical protein